ncbi:hypothetical protein BS78_K230000 [Paspalum vaginatum]|uniref:Cysteine proteinase inhibitor n=1 Tax=Paspalum vaginatum TaxID=158149 RepID=A0A9W7XEY2_9POAL|nr:hypothetical protein BS78_K015000 [Paspalum vaginatum]KAJ1257054.1 hypothetical protein BS78_K230000 [Paspalum vaginatum]
MKQSAVVAVLPLLAMAAALQVAADLAPPAGYTKEEDVTTYFIQQVGKFSVNVYKIAYMIYMNYVSTSQCWSKPAEDGGNYYWMVLSATNGSGTAGTYVSTVWGIPGSESKTWKLLSFNSTN